MALRCGAMPFFTLRTKVRWVWQMASRTLRSGSDESLLKILAWKCVGRLCLSSALRTEWGGISYPFWNNLDNFFFRIGFNSSLQLGGCLEPGCGVFLRELPDNHRQLAINFLNSGQGKKRISSAFFPQEMAKNSERRRRRRKAERAEDRSKRHWPVPLRQRKKRRKKRRCLWPPSLLRYCETNKIKCELQEPRAKKKKRNEEPNLLLLGFALPFTRSGAPFFIFGGKGKMGERWRKEEVFFSFLSCAMEIKKKEKESSRSFIESFFPMTWIWTSVTKGCWKKSDSFRFSF